MKMLKYYRKSIKNCKIFKYLTNYKNYKNLIENIQIYDQFKT